MTMLRIRFIAITLFVSLHGSSFCMDAAGTLINSAYRFPQDMQEIIFDDMNPCSQGRMRKTCRYWKKIGDSRISYPAYLLDLLHSPQIHELQHRSRILFAAIYHSDYKLAEIILKKTPADVCLCYSGKFFAGIEEYNPYVAAQFVGDNDMISLFECYQYNQGIVKFGSSEKDVLKALVITCISGNRDSIAKIIDVDLKRPDVRAQLNDEIGGFSRLSMFWIQNAFEIIVQNDDLKSIPAVMLFCFNNPRENWLIEVLAQRAWKIKSKKAFEALVQQHKNINAVMNGSYNHQEKKITFKNMILGINWPSDIHSESQEYYKEIEAILNTYGAKTYEELEAEKVLQ